jgi:hypothetical protein
MLVVFISTNLPAIDLPCVSVPMIVLNGYVPGPGTDLASKLVSVRCFELPNPYAGDLEITEF